MIVCVVCARVRACVCVMKPLLIYGSAVLTIIEVNFFILERGCPDPISRNERSKVRSNKFAVCESTNIPVYLPIDIYGVLQYQALQIFLSICQMGLLVHYISHDF